MTAVSGAPDIDNALAHHVTLATPAEPKVARVVDSGQISAVTRLSTVRCAGSAETRSRSGFVRRVASWSSDHRGGDERSVPCAGHVARGYSEGNELVRNHAPSLCADSQSSQAEGSRIVVAVRCRPLSEQEDRSGGHDICKVIDRKLVVLCDPGCVANDYLRADKSREKRFAYDIALGSEASTAELFAATTQPLVGAVMQAYNATVFAYGSTGAGKTFTMIGTPQVPGVMLRTVQAIFEQVEVDRSKPGPEGRHAIILCTFVEVYNENIRDLLAPQQEYLDLREDPQKGMCVAGVFEAKADSAVEVMELLRHGNFNRTTEPTSVNVTSSRSHAVLQVTVEQRDRSSQDVLVGKLSLVDLAGCERASQTNNQGVRLIEGANINRSLLSLGNCINALASGCSFVPYRDSKLTRLLKDSLGGNCRTVMVANISPSHLSYEDTLNTLKYANRAKNIRLSARQNVYKVQTHVSQYERLIDDLRGEVDSLRAKLMAVPAGVCMVNAPVSAAVGAQALHESSALDTLPPSVGGVQSGISVSGDTNCVTGGGASSSSSAPAPTASAPSSARGSVGDRTPSSTWLADQQAASEHWKEEVVKNLDLRTQLQRSLVEVERALVQWYVERDRAKNVIVRWDERSGGPLCGSSLASPSRARRSQPRTLEEWRDQLQQIEESIRENADARRSIAARLGQNKSGGKELQAQLPRRVLDEDLRAFLELVQRVQILEVERLELDHLQEARRAELSDREQVITALREQLRLREDHLSAQREFLSTEQQQQQPPSQATLLGCTLGLGKTAQKTPFRVIHAWVPPIRGSESIKWDSRPLREREPQTNPREEMDLDSPDGLPRNIDWREIEVPRAARIRGAARIHPPTQSGAYGGPIVPGCPQRRLAHTGVSLPVEVRGVPSFAAAPIATTGTPGVAAPASPSVPITSSSPGMGGPQAAAPTSADVAPLVVTRRNPANSCPAVARRGGVGVHGAGAAPGPGRRRPTVDDDEEVAVILRRNLGGGGAGRSVAAVDTGGGQAFHGLCPEVVPLRGVGPSNTPMRRRAREAQQNRERDRPCRMKGVGRLIVQPKPTHGVGGAFEHLNAQWRGLQGVPAR